MVKGLDTFQKYFADFEEQYVLIGGAACDILFESNEVNFRATRDLAYQIYKIEDCYRLSLCFYIFHQR